MGQRVRYGTFAILVVVTAFALDVSVAEGSRELEGAWGALLRRGSLIPALFVVVALCGATELCRLMRAAGARPHRAFAHLMVAALVVTPWLSAAGWLGSGPAQVEGLYWQVVLLIVACTGAGVLSVARGRPDGALRDFGATLTIVLYLGFLTSFGLQLRCGCDIPGQAGAWLLLVTLLVTKASDIGAYFTGTLFGRHKLAPLISPGKSVEGALGGLLASALVAWSFGSAPSLATALFPDRFFVGEFVEIAGSFASAQGRGEISPGIRAILFGLSLSLVGQVGDLLESCFKRDAGIKDSGKVLPRFGGILDLIDSPVLALPVAWLLLTVVWRVV